MWEFEKYAQQNKILILGGGSYLGKYPNVTLGEIYHPVQGKWERDLRKFYEHIPALSQRRWYGDWQQNIEEYGTIIIVNGIRGRDLIEYMRERNPRARIIIYYETTIDPTDRKAPNRYEGLGCEFYSFDQQDCRDWGCRYLHYFYMYHTGDMQAVRQAARTGPDSDIFFCGYDKGRLDTLAELHGEFARLGLQDRLFIIRTPHKWYFNRNRRYLTRHTLPYERLREYICRSRCLLDIVEQGQRGLTLRPMEAIFYGRKLITNNPAVQNYDFYRPENVFLLGQRPIAELPEFIRAPYAAVPAEIVERYTAEAWLDGFFQEPHDGRECK